jgi:hypothetical protein
MGWFSKSDTNFTYEDYEINGRYCKSGLAFPTTNISATNPGPVISANCTATDRIFYEGKNLSSPFSCDPTNQTRRCFLFYNSSYPNDAITLS